MKRGLHLGRKSPRTRALARLLLVGLLAGAALLSARLVESRRAVSALRAELAALQARTEAVEPILAGEPRVVARLRAVLASGAPEALPPTALLDLLGVTLPDEVTLSGLSIKASPPGPSMTVEATTRSAAAITELQRRMDESPLVRATSVLDERRGTDGGLAVRLQVDLDRGGLP